MAGKIKDAWMTLRGKSLADGFLQRSQYFDPDQMLEYQLKSFRKVLENAEKFIPFYQNLFKEQGFDIKSFQSFEDLQKLPILEKDLVRSQAIDFYSAPLIKGALEFQTSGTTGHPFKSYTCPQQWIVEQGVIWRHWSWAGYKFRDKMAILRSYNPNEGKPKYYLDKLRNWMYFSPYHMSEKDILEYLQVLTKWQPKFLRGYPSSLYLTAKVALQHNIQLPSVKAALTASETLSAEQRSVIRQAFNIEVFDHYGQAELTCMLHECEKHEGVHINSEYGHVELVPSEVEGQYKLIATNIHNHVMPLIRYNTGDLVEKSEKPCSCGRTLPLIKKVIGRKDEFLLHKEGYKIPTVNMYTYFSKKQQVYRFQLIQWSTDQIEVRLQLKPGVEKNSLLKNIKQDLESKFQGKVEVKETDNFMTSGGGKCLPILQKVKLAT